MGDYDNDVLGPEDLEGLSPLDKYLADLNADASFVKEQSKEADRDTAFISQPEGQWDDYLVKTHGKKSQRVKLTLDLVSASVQEFVGEWGENSVNVDYKPSDAATTAGDAGVLQGLYRANFRDYGGDEAISNAVQEVAICGQGAWRLVAQYEDETDIANKDQVITFKPVYNPYQMLFWDRSATSITKEDARHVTLIDRYSRTGFDAAFPGKAASSVGTDNFIEDRSIYAYDDVIYVGTRYEVIRDHEKVLVYSNLTENKVETFTEEQMKDHGAKIKKNKRMVFQSEKMVVRQKVMKTVFSGQDILIASTRIAGKYIPIIPAWGYRVFHAGQERSWGLVRKLIDSARLFNTLASKMAEVAGSSGVGTPMVHPDQVKNDDVKASLQSPQNVAYQIIGALEDKDGKIVQAGPVGYTQPLTLDGATGGLIEMVTQFIQNQTGGMPQEAMDPNASGKAIRAVMKRVKMMHQPMNQNIARAIRWSGVVYAAMASDIYSTARTIDVIKADGQRTQEMLYKQVIVEENGQQRTEQTNVITGRRFKAFADVGPQHETLQEETIEQLKGALGLLSEFGEAGGKYATVLLSTLMANINGVGLEVIRDFARKDMLVQEIIKPETDEDKQILAEAKQKQQAAQEGPQQQVMEAIVDNQKSEAMSLRAGTAVKMAQVEKTVADTQLMRAKTLDTEAGILQGARKLDLDEKEQQAKQNTEVAKLMQQARVNGST